MKKSQTIREKLVPRATIQKVVDKVFAQVYSKPNSRIETSGVAFYPEEDKPSGKKLDLIYGFGGKKMYVEIKASKGTKNYKDLMQLLSTSRIKSNKSSVKKKSAAKKKSSTKKRTSAKKSRSSRGKKKTVKTA
jgi:hypothetical protein